MQFIIWKRQRWHLFIFVRHTICFNCHNFFLFSLDYREIILAFKNVCMNEEENWKVLKDKNSKWKWTFIFDVHVNANEWFYGSLPHLKTPSICIFDQRKRSSERYFCLRCDIALCSFEMHYAFREKLCHIVRWMVYLFHSASAWMYKCQMAWMTTIKRFTSISKFSQCTQFLRR